MEGLVDFSKATTGPKWYQRLQLILSGLSRRNRRELQQLMYHEAVAVYTSQRLKADQLSDVAQRVSDLYHDIRETYYPQDKNLRVQQEKAVVRQDITNWKARFGDSSDAKTRQKLSEFAEAMERLRLDTAQQMRSQAASQLGYMGRELGINPSQKPPRKGRK